MSGRKKRFEVAAQLIDRAARKLSPRRRKAWVKKAIRKAGLSKFFDRYRTLGEWLELLSRRIPPSIADAWPGNRRSAEKIARLLAAIGYFCRCAREAVAISKLLNRIHDDNRAELYLAAIYEDDLGIIELSKSHAELAEWIASIRPDAPLREIDVVIPPLRPGHLVKLKRALDRRRKRWIRRRRPLQFGSREYDLRDFVEEVPDEQFRSERLAALRRAVADLDDSERILLALRWGEPTLKLREIGAILGLSKSTVSHRIAGILITLRTAMRPFED